MRKVININKGWLFSKDCSLDKKVLPLENYENIDLPHTWNATDGQDGGADYYRGTCLYFLYNVYILCRSKNTSKMWGRRCSWLFNRIKNTILYRK